MDEEKETPAEEPVTEDSGEGDKPKEITAIRQANEAAERLEAANKKQEELLGKQEEMIAEQRLGGNTEAGAPAPEQAKLTDTEYAEKVERGEASPLADDGFI